LARPVPKVVPSSRIAIFLPAQWTAR
jgi:hypothetical protein